MILYVNSCVRTESRTHRIALSLLKKLGGEYEEVKLSDANLSPLTEDTLDRRNTLIAAGDFDHPAFSLARQFSTADTIVISAPFWDYSFPACLKIYLENIFVIGLVSRYGPDGTPIGLCRAKKLYFVTTAGGPYLSDYSFDYVKTLAKISFGIPEVELIAAEMLDVDGFNADEIVEDTIKNL